GPWRVARKGGLMRAWTAAPSDPAPMAGVATTLPASGSDTAMTRFEQTENSRRFFASKARPEGPSHGLNEYFLTTAALTASISTISLVSSMFTYPLPFPSATENSGLPGSGIVPATLPDLASIAVALFDRPLNANTRPETASYRMESGFSPVAAVPTGLSVLRSKIVTLFPRP